MQQKKQEVKMDLVKIFLTPPNTMKEKITLIAMMLVIFVMFYGPLTFSEMSPVKAIIICAFPSISVSWGWIVLLRSLFRKKDFCKEDKK